MQMDEQRRQAAEPVDPDVAVPDSARVGTGIGPRWRGGEGPVLLVVGLGGVLGAVARYGLGLWWPTASGAFPWTTFVINVVGCFLIGVLLVLVSEIFTPHRLIRPLLGTGVLGGFTTFSTYAVDAQRLVDGRHAGTALVYLGSTVVAALVAVTVAARATRAIVASAGRR